MNNTHHFSEKESYIIKNALHYRLRQLEHIRKNMQSFPNYDLIKSITHKIKNGESDFSHQEVRAQVYCLLRFSALPMFSDINSIKANPKISDEDKFYFTRVHSKYSSALFNAINIMLNAFILSMSNDHKAVGQSIVKRMGGLTPKALQELLML